MDWTWETEFYKYTITEPESLVSYDCGVAFITSQVSDFFVIVENKKTGKRRRSRYDAPLWLKMLMTNRVVNDLVENFDLYKTKPNPTGTALINRTEIVKDKDGKERKVRRYNKIRLNSKRNREKIYEKPYVTDIITEETNKN